MTNKIILKNAKFVSNTFPDGSQQHIGIVRGDSFIKTHMSTDKTNPREFMGEKNKNFKDMVKTLKTEPEMFSRKNSAGVTVFATALENNGDGSYTLILGDNDGIANGGHTYNALKRFGTDKSYVKFVVEIGVNYESIVEITKSLNSHKKIESWGAHDLEGKYVWYKKALGERHEEISYHEGEVGKIGIIEAIAYLNLFKRDHITKELDIMANIKRSEEGAGQIINKIVKDTALANDFRDSLKWIAKDVHELSVDFTFNENIVTLLSGHKQATGQEWTTKTRNSKQGVSKVLMVLLMGGLAYVGTELNKNGIVTWKQGFEVYGQRQAFLLSLFEDILSYTKFKTGTAHQISREIETRGAVLQAAKVLARGVRV